VIAGQDDWGKLRVGGADRVRFLQGMLTNDVAKLAPGAFLKAAILNVKGRVLAVVDAIAEEASFLILTEAITAAKVKDIFVRHAIADDVTFDDVSSPLHRVWASPADVWTAPPVLTAATSSPEDEIELRRVEGGLPRYGADVSEDYFPFEAHLDAAISHTKGCYVGQEVVARATARGHANKRLMGVKLDAPRVAGDKLGDKATITSAVVSPDFGPIALAYVHKTVWDPGVKLDGGTVVALPFA
jgi:folate-binding protein YgfZ